MRGQCVAQRDYVPSTLCSAMVVVTSISPSSSSLRSPTPLTSKLHLCKSISPAHFFRPRTKTRYVSPKSNSITAYMESSNSIAGFANKVIGSLPVIGLFVRIVSDEGGVGSDIIDFAEFRRRVGKKSTVMDSRAFYEFQERHGKPGEPLFVLLCCWLAAVGAGLLKSEEILEGVARLPISNDIEFEEQNFISMMNEARERRSKMKVSAPSIPMEVRVEKAVEAIYACCFSENPIEEEDEQLLGVMLSAVFPSVKRSEIENMIQEKARKVGEGGDNVRKLKPLSKEAVEMQMKDLQFLRQNSESGN